MSFINVVIYVVVALGAVLGMAYLTNKKIKDYQNTENLKMEKIALYQNKGIQLILLFVLAVVSGICGYKIGEQARSTLAVIKIGSCYMATLGAAVIDYKLKIIPNFISLSLVILRLLFLVYEFLFLETAVEFLLGSLIGCLVSFLFLGIANKLSKGGIGAGDIKLLAAIGFMSDIYTVLKTLMLALLVCVVVAMLLLALKKQTWKDHLPFGPFIYAGFVGMCLLTL